MQELSPQAWRPPDGGTTGNGIRQTNLKKGVHDGNSFVGHSGCVDQRPWGLHKVQGLLQTSPERCLLLLKSHLPEQQVIMNAVCHTSYMQNTTS